MFLSSKRHVFDVEDIYMHMETVFAGRSLCCKNIIVIITYLCQLSGVVLVVDVLANQTQH